MGNKMMPHNKKKAGHMRVKRVKFLGPRGSGKYLTKCGIETWTRFTVQNIKGVTCKDCKKLIDDSRGKVTVLPERKGKSEWVTQVHRVGGVILKGGRGEAAKHKGLTTGMKPSKGVKGT